MKNINSSILFFAFILLAFPLSAQKVKLNTTTAKYPSALKSDDRQKVIETLENFMNDYAEAASLFDEKKRRVTSESIDKFQSFFHPTARVIRDYEEFYVDGTIGVRTYADQVFNRMLRKGLKVKLLKAKLSEIKYDASGYWTATIELEKAFYNATTGNQDVKEIPSGRFMQQVLQVDVKTNNLERAKIASIRCLGCQGVLVDNFVRFVGPSFGLHSGSYNPSLSSFWNNNHSSSNYTAKGGLGFSIGVDFLTNSFLGKGKEKKNLFLTGGLRYSLYKISSEVSDFALSPFAEVATMGTINLDYMRSARDIQFTEDLSVGLIEIPIGVAYRLANNNKSSILVGLKLVPSFVLSGSGSIAGSGTYDAELSEAMWRLLEEGASNPDEINEPTKFGPFNAGEQIPIQQDANPSTSGFALGIQLSPTYYLHLAEAESSWSILFGLDLNLHLGSFFSHDNASDDLLKFANDYNTSFLQHYTDGMSGFSYGLRIGLHHRFDRRP